MTRDLPGALVITFHKKEIEFLDECAFSQIFYNIKRNVNVKTSQQWFDINGKNAFGCPLRLGLYLKVKCMNRSETNFSRTTESQPL